jgi:hypothetical protein
MLLRTLAAAQRVTRAVAVQCRSISLRPARTWRAARAARREPSVSSHSADQTSPGIAGVAAPALAAAVAASPGRSAAGNGDDLTTTAARTSPAAADDAADVTGKPPIVSGGYIYGYDSAGNPTLADAPLLLLLRRQAAGLMAGLAAGGSVYPDEPASSSSRVGGAKSQRARQAPEAREERKGLSSRVSGPGHAVVPPARPRNAIYGSPVARLDLSHPAIPVNQRTALPWP